MLNQNRLLQALSPIEHQRLLPLLEYVPMQRGWLLNRPGDEAYLYFPTTSTISLLIVMGDGDSWEGAVIGNDGLVGTSLLTGVLDDDTIAEVQTAGGSYRINASLLKKDAASTDALRDLATRYMHALTTQMTQTGACSRHHRIEQQLSRWILLRLDRLKSHEIAITQGELGMLLGVRRQLVAAGIESLQTAGILEYTRGKIKVLTRPQLEAQACECYQVIRQETERMFASVNAIKGKNIRPGRR